MNPEEAALNLNKRIVEEVVAYFGINALSIGCDLDLFAYISAAGNQGITPEELAEVSNCNLRCIREWLECCAVNNYINLKEDGRFFLLPGYDTVLLNKESPLYQRPMLKFLPGVSSCYSKLVESFKTGSGVPYKDFGDACFQAIKENNVTIYSHNLIPVIMPSFPELHEKFQTQGGTICDVGCGAGELCLLFARCFEKVNVIGVDLDDRSIDKANLALTGESDSVKRRVRFINNSFENIEEEEYSFDMITFFLALHDIPDPEKSLITCKRFLKPDIGRIAVLEVNVQDNISDMCIEPGVRPPSLQTNATNVFGRLAYGLSVTLCLPCTMSQPHNCAAGAAFSRPKIQVEATKAGFQHVEFACIVKGPFKVYRIY